MNKPTAQELWGRIETEVEYAYSSTRAKDGNYLADSRVKELMEEIKTYAQTYHEEEMDKFQLAHYVGVTHDNRLCFTDPQNPGAIIILNQPNQ